MDPKTNAKIIKYMEERTVYETTEVLNTDRQYMWEALIYPNLSGPFCLQHYLTIFTNIESHICCSYSKKIPDAWLIIHPSNKAIYPSVLDISLTCQNLTLPMGYAILNLQWRGCVWVCAWVCELIGGVIQHD